MAVNTFLISGVVQRISVSSRKQPAAVLIVQYGPPRQKTDQEVQFLNVAIVRVPHYVYERHKDKLKENVFVDIVGHIQGVQRSPVGSTYNTNELVATKIDIEADDEDEDAQDQGNDAAAEDAAEDNEVEAA